MKKRALCLLLVFVFLTGCASMLNREYVTIEPHDQFSNTGTDSSALRAENYQGLVNAILYLVSEGTGNGVVRMYNYTRDVETDLNSACLEVTKEDPLGAYAVDYIKYDFTRIVSYYEANVQIKYRRTREQMKCVVSVTGSSAIKGELRDALTEFSPEVALRVNYFAEDEDYIIRLVEQAYYDTPEVAFGLPDIAVTLYPDSGFQRIVELTLTYPDTNDALGQMRDALKVASENDVTQLRAGQGELPEAIYALLRNNVLCHDSASGTYSNAYAALVDGRADSEGVALAFHLLCRLVGVESIVVSGTRAGEPCFWNMVNTGTVWWHVDAAQDNALLLTDHAMMNAGYLWAADSYPVCNSTVGTEG